MAGEKGKILFPRENVVAMQMCQFEADFAIEFSRFGSSERTSDDEGGKV